ncbi:MAG: DUF5117 domain-containing protein [Planctomycetaceae bacterium]|nr:DUF5117 domain-containing protein [Planctomycetaceae bacterium]MBT4724815.1 DUF5117 domain-containing protein [Planctomycetaceae bacterium]
MKKYLASFVCLFSFVVCTVAQEAPKPEFPPHTTVLKGYDKVVSTADGARSMYTLWTRSKDGQVYAELPPTFAQKRYFIALTVASGDKYAGLQSGDYYVYWRRYNNKLALIVPDLDTRSNGDPESLSSVNRLFTDTMLLTIPIITIGPSGGPVIDLDSILVGKASKFFGPSVVNREMGGLFKLQKAKAFPLNVELAFEIPTASGKLSSLHYSISELNPKSTYRPRVADERIGYFITSYSDLGKYKDDETKVRYINRWHLEKRDPRLKISPPKNPIVFYIEHTTPVRYRRWVKEGIQSWNSAFEKIGISDALEVYYQDKTTGAHMDKDPEDVRYNFVRWLNNDIGTAIGPSRVNPNTGQILDADIILTDGWIRHFRYEFDNLLPKIAMEGFSAETLSWLASNPEWDPRLAFAHSSQREYVRQQLTASAGRAYGGHPATLVDNTLLGDDEYDGLIGRVSQVNGSCMASQGMAFDVAIMRMVYEIQASQVKADDAVKEDVKEDVKAAPQEPVVEEMILDGMPESFIGPQLSHLVAHEVGHTLGLRHNFKASSAYTLEQINSVEHRGKPIGGSVMDYTPTNIRFEAGTAQGDYSMHGIGPYDYWAIEYGYTFEKDLLPILARVSEPELQFATDEDTGGPDPLARRYDYGKDPLNFAQDQMKLANHHRGLVLDKFVKDGDSWSKARRGYQITLSMQARAISMMGNWVGGVHVYRDKKGDAGDRAPLQVVPVAQQRAAIDFVVNTAFHDEAFGLTTELLQRMSTDKWLDGGSRQAVSDPDWPIHDRIAGIQSSALTILLNPSTLRRVYDNEFRIAADQDALTLPELLETVSSTIWGELDQEVTVAASARKPAISSLRRNLQREHVKRLVDLAMTNSGSNQAYKPISNLARAGLRATLNKVNAFVGANADKLDAYSAAHLAEIQNSITKALDADVVVTK